MSRMTSSDQRSPSASSEMLTGHPERWRGLGLLCTVQKLSDIACILQAIFCPTWVHGQGRTLASLEWRCEGKQNARPGICQDGRSLLKETYRLLLLADVVDESDRDPFGILRRAVRAHADVIELRPHSPFPTAADPNVNAAAETEGKRCRGRGDAARRRGEMRAAEE